MRDSPWMPTLLILMAAAGGCAQAEPPRNMEPTQTNEEGCTRQRSLGRQDPYLDPAPLKQACVGPYLLTLPQNYFYNQMGTEFDGLFALALEYPSLQPFKPGERMNLTVDVATRTVAITYAHISRVDVWQAMRGRYTPMEHQQADPAASLSGRLKGEKVHGLAPYYIDMDKVRTYHRAEGRAEAAPVMAPSYHTDWFVSQDASGRIDQVIKCTPREITESGVEYRGGKMVKKRVVGLATCQQTFVVEELKTLVEMDYPREGLVNWRQMSARATALLTDNILKDETE